MLNDGPDTARDRFDRVVLANWLNFANGAFEYNEEGKAVVGDISKAAPEQLKAAEDQCPAMAIAISGLQIGYPAAHPHAAPPERLIGQRG